MKIGALCQVTIPGERALLSHFSATSQPLLSHFSATSQPLLSHFLQAEADGMVADWSDL